MRTAVLKAFGLAAVLACSSRAANQYRPDFDAQGPQVATAAVDLAATRQRIEGFGASSAWTTLKMSDEQAEQFFSIDHGIGLTLLRVHITPKGTTDELVTAQKAVGLGVKVWAAPWSPPAEWKDNGTLIDGGNLLSEHWQDWADRLAAFAKSMADQGVPLVALSAQNEPGFAAKWETCEWTPEDLVTFVRDFLGPALAREALTIPILAPETQDWSKFASFAAPLLADPAAAAFLGPLATHAYGSATAYPYPAAGRSVWVSEISDSGPVDPGMDAGLWAAEKVHDSLVRGGVNAFHWWWLTPGRPEDRSGLTEMGQLTRRAWAIANWSRFVRPGFVRVDATETPQAGLSVSAFADPDSGRVVIVAINGSDGELSQAFAVAGGPVAATATPWVTSDDFALAAQAPIAVTAGAFTYTLPARSVTSFVTN